jgi:hypothetical protein
VGLDMYLYKRHYIPPHRKPFGELTQQVLDQLVPGINPSRICLIDERMAYWRKANQIHYWFVLNVMDGDDDCREHEVSREQLVELRGVVRRVLKKHKLAVELLPAQDGFFFGSTEYDQDYFNELRETDEQLTAALDEELGDDAWFVYGASW